MIPAPDRTYLLPITEDDARNLLADIRSDFHEIGMRSRSVIRKVRHFDEQAGWKVLHYGSLVDCLSAELGVVAQTGYRYLKATIVSSNIREHSDPDSPIGDIPEYHVRDTGIADLPPEEQAAAYKDATVLAQSEGYEKPTHDHVVRAVGVHKTRNSVFESPYPIITNMVINDQITGEVGRQLVEKLEHLQPKQRTEIVKLVGKFELCNPDLVQPIAAMFFRRPGQESKVLPEVLNGFLNGVTLKKATLTDLAAANHEAWLEHLAESDELKRLQGDPLPVAITLYRGDMRKSVDSLMHEMGCGFVENLRDYLMRV